MKRRAKPYPMVSPYPIVPRELAGKWIAWHRREIVDSGERLGELMDRIEAAGLRGMSYEIVPMGRRGHIG